MLTTAGANAGRWLGGVLMDFMNSRLAFALGLSLYFLGSYLAIILRADTLSLVYTASILYGVAYGWTFSCAGTIVGHYYGPAAFSKLYGTMTFLISLFASPAGWVGGKLFDIYGNYTKAIELNALLAAVGILAIAFATMPRPKAQSQLSVSAVQQAAS